MWARWRAIVCRILPVGLVCAWLAVLSSPAAAARVVVVLSNDSAPYQEVYQTIRGYLDSGPHETDRVYADGLSASALGDAQLVVTVGVRAAKSLAAQPVGNPVLAVLVPRAWYLENGRSELAGDGKRAVSAIYLDQPFQRQAQLIRLAFPEMTRVGVLLGTRQRKLLGELADALQTQGISLVYGLLSGEERQIAQLEAVLSEAEMLLAIPDPRVINRNTAQSLLLTSYRYRDPVLGYSRSLTRAGALLSLHSSPAQIGRQAAEWVRRVIETASSQLPESTYPAYFSVSINRRVAHSLGFVLPQENELEKRLGEEI
ncbi:MAG: ABC transporter substrate-binding protein [Thiobacillus sp.]